jgi:hypothetical protein
METQYQGWIDEHWDAEHRMFRWDGMHDGMETNINSRLTSDTFAGAEGYRPTLNSYLYADALAIAKTARLLGDEAKAEQFATRAAELKQRVQDERCMVFAPKASPMRLACTREARTVGS